MSTAALLAAALATLPAVCEVLRPYQRALIASLLDALRRDIGRVLMAAPTGAGKTHIVAAVVAACEIAGLRVLILAPRTRLIRQLHERLDAFGVHHGVMAAALPQWADLFARVQIASVDTLLSRAVRSTRAPLPSADVVIFDEAHLALGESRVRLLEQYPDAVLIGLTATPAKTSGRSLGSMFDHLVLGPSVRELIDLGALVRARIFAPPTLAADDLRGVTVSTSSGDYAVGELAEVMSRPRIVGDVVSTWLRLAAGKRTLVFACDKSHGAHLVDEFLRAGVAAELLTDADDDDVREAAIARLEAGTTSVLVNCFLLSYGIDVPSVECISLARPTRSVPLYLQAIGRGMRTASGKDSVLILDHGRVVESLGLPTDDFGWSLEDGANVNAAARETQCKRVRSAERPRQCAECAAVWSVREDGNACPECGWAPAPRARDVIVADGELHEIGGGEPANTLEAMEQFCREAIGFYCERWPDRAASAPRKARFWAWCATCRRFGRKGVPMMPKHFWQLEPLEPSAAAAGWLKSDLIRWARSQQRGGYRAAV